MTTPFHSIPWILLALDGLGTILIVLGVLALMGFDFGHPVLTTVAPGFIGLGVALMLPFVVWIVRSVVARR